MSKFKRAPLSTAVQNYLALHSLTVEPMAPADFLNYARLYSVYCNSVETPGKLVWITEIDATAPDEQTIEDLKASATMYEL